MIEENSNSIKTINKGKIPKKIYFPSLNLIPCVIERMLAIKTIRPKAKLINKIYGGLRTSGELTKLLKRGNKITPTIAI